MRRYLPSLLVLFLLFTRHPSHATSCSDELFHDIERRSGQICQDMQNWLQCVHRDFEETNDAAFLPKEVTALRTAFESGSASLDRERLQDRQIVYDMIINRLDLLFRDQEHAQNPKDESLVDTRHQLNQMHTQFQCLSQQLLDLEKIIHQVEVNSENQAGTPYLTFQDMHKLNPILIIPMEKTLTKLYQLLYENGWSAHKVLVDIYGESFASQLASQIFDIE